MRPIRPRAFAIWSGATETIFAVAKAHANDRADPQYYVSLSSTLLVAWWLIAAASGPGYFDFVNGFFGSWFGMLILFGYTWALMHHLLGGLRHFAWDTGRLMSKEMSTKLAYATFIGSGSLTVLIWIIGLVAR